MTDLTKIEKPYVFCTKEEQEGLKALIGVEGALQYLSNITGDWIPRRLNTSFHKGYTYRQNPDWEAPKLDVPDWFWANTDVNYVAMDKAVLEGRFKGVVHASIEEPTKRSAFWVFARENRFFRLDNFFTHDFNPHNIPWDQSLTKRPGLIE